MLEVRTGCRLHFGLMELAKDQELRFGGLGLMLEQPGWRLEFQPSVASPATSLESQIDEVSARVEHVRRRNSTANCRILTRTELPLHHGLGAGTQLACAVAAGQSLFNRFTQGEWPCERKGHEEWTSVARFLPQVDPTGLAQLSGRGLRSAVGLYGFLYGGFIFDRGYTANAESRPVDADMLYWPENWQAVLITPRATTAVTGEQEAKLLREIGLKPNPHRDEMLQLAMAAQTCVKADPSFERLMELLEEYMLLAAKLFAAHQGGVYNGPEAMHAAACAQSTGLRGVGQSSWGPTIFGFAKDPHTAAQAAHVLQNQSNHWAVTIAKPARQGAQWRVRD